MLGLIKILKVDQWRKGYERCIEKIQKKSKMIPQKEIEKLTDKELREIILSLRNETWEEDAPIRKLAIRVFGDDYVISMLALAPELAIELEKRTR